MWNSDDYIEVDDDVVADGASVRNRVSFPHQTNIEDSTNLCENKFSTKLNTDSGFLSGLSTSDDSAVITSSSINITEEQKEMQLKSAPQFSASEFKSDISSEKKNNLNEPTPVKSQKGVPRRITLHDLLRQDDDGDT